MNPRDLVREAATALVANRLRSTLSSLGMIGGVATVIAALAIGEGARRSAYEEIASLGIDNVLIRSDRPAIAPGAPAAAPLLTVGDAAALRALPGVVAVTARRSARPELTAGAARLTAPLVGVTPEWQAIAGTAITGGRWLSDADVERRSRVMVIGPRAAQTLFGAADPLGASVRAAGDWYRIVGVLAPATAGGKRSAMLRVDSDSAAFVPLDAMDLPLGAGDRAGIVEEIIVKASGAREVERTAAAAAALMKRRDASRAIQTTVPRELLRARLRAQRTFTAVLVAIGGLALLISGVGIMNIMLASVAERTAEIGVRRALGAREQDVVRQFALEAALLAAAGGLAGIPAGIALAGAVAIGAGWPVGVSLFSLAIALALAATVGLAAGVYPARRAAAIQPIEALRAG